MICAFCHKNVSEPCHSMQEMQQRAESHVQPCERAFQRQGGGMHPRRAPSTGMKSGGKA